MLKTPPQFARLGILTFLVTFFWFTVWRFSNYGPIASDDDIGITPPIHDPSHKHGSNIFALPKKITDAQDDDEEDEENHLSVGDGGTEQPFVDDYNHGVITITTTVTQVETTTRFIDRMPYGGHPTFVAELETTSATPTATIIRDFEKYHGLVEDYEEKLSLEDLQTVQKAVTESTRQKRLRRMYDLDGADQWLQFVQDQDDSAMPPFTKFAQDFIYKWQNPPPSECENRQFLVLHHNWDGNGLGTVVHGTGWVLGLAIRLNRTLIYDDAAPPGKNFLEKDCAGKKGPRSLDCIFEPFSSCSSSKHLRKGNHIKLESYWKVPQDISMSTSAVPPIFGHLLKTEFPQMHPDAIKYWWRAQAAAYMMRMNGRALRRLKSLRIDRNLHSASTYGHTRQPVPATVPFPLPDGSFSAHVRHGDKGVEIELIPFRKYVDRAEEYAAMNMIMTRKICFISTEDASVIEEAKLIGNAWISRNTTSNENWTWIWSNIPRINGGPVEQLNSFGNRTDMSIKWMMQLFFAIEAPNILGTRGSGWNRMIDELRCIWVDCRTPYMEVGPFEDWVHYNF
ncbi:hypothetical protein TWF694_010215 [Orbilia ellipsospora]|uniref:Uncharacterized protein n=1 Tax=Orbilia ellipsospora TaxID=2528407 RepID=A0AAV9X992_9PEZI